MLIFVFVEKTLEKTPWISTSNVTPIKAPTGK